MSTNASKLATLYKPATVPLDLGGYADAYAGETLNVNVTAPGVIEHNARVEKNDFDSYRASVSVLFDLPAETVATLDDNFLMWLFVEGTRVYAEYHNALKKKSSDN